MHRMKFLCIIFLLSSFIGTAQRDTTVKDTAEYFNVDVTLSTRNVWRGLTYGKGPSVQGDFYLKVDSFKIGALGTVTMNGSKSGYGNWMELYTSYSYKGFELTFDDYFFFGSVDSLNNYFDLTREKTNHFLETRLKYKYKQASILAGYSIYCNKASINKGVYLEGEYTFRYGITATLEYLTDASDLSFYSREGFTSVGISYKRIIHPYKMNIPLKASFSISPNHSYATKGTGVGTNPVNLVLSINF